MWKTRSTNVNNFVVAFLLVLLSTVMIPVISQDAPLMNFSSISDSEKKLSINISANDFITSNDNYVDAIVLFEPNIEVSIDGLEVKRSYENLNGFYATMPSSLYEYLKTAWYVCAIEKDQTFSLPSTPNNRKIYSTAEDIETNDNISLAVQPSDLNDMLSWGVDWINAERVWGETEDALDVVNENKAGLGIKVGIIDTGINYDHPDLDENYISGIDYVNNDNDPMDDRGHGTHVAGIIAAEDNDEPNVIGVAPKVSIYGIKVLNSSGRGFISDIIAGIDWAIDNEMDIINLSLGTPEDTDALHNAIDRAWDAGIVVVVAGGNYISNYYLLMFPYKQILYPAKYENTISVGNLKPVYDSPLDLEPISVTRQERSSYGDELDLCAPGTDIISTYLGDSLALGTGSSMAAPMIAGICALILSVDLFFSPDDVKNILIEVASNLGDPGHDKYYGHGQVDAYYAVEEAKTRQPTDSDNDGLPDKQEIRLGTNPYVDADIDSDGLSDSDEVIVHGTNPTYYDTDYDLLSDYDEIFLYGTDPLELDSDGDGLNDWLEIRIHKTDPTLEDTDGDGLLDYEEVYTYDTKPLNPDSDGDGLTDYEEVMDYGTDPNDSDTDNDLLSDSWELTHSYQGQPFDPKDSTDGTTDHDGDLLQTGEEVYIWGTNWLNPDCDNDGFSDGFEIFFFGSDPLSASSTPETQDSDGDGYTDWEEYTGEFNVDYDNEPTDWFSADSDGDGWSDWFEIHWGFDPNDPNSNPFGGGGFMP